MRFQTLLNLALLGFTLMRPGPSAPGDHTQSGGLDGSMVEENAGPVSGFVAAGWVVGAELLIERDGHTVLHRALSMRDGETMLAMEPGTIFNIRSMAWAWSEQELVVCYLTPYCPRESR
jgi:CubicO group peptidase (beta-lactamase class C family)